MSNIIYKSKTHSKTIEMIQSIIDEIRNKQRERDDVNVSIVINKTPMVEYHLGFILDKLEENGFNVDYSFGHNTVNIYVEKKEDEDEKKDEFEINHNYYAKWQLLKHKLESVSDSMKILNRIDGREMLDYVLETIETIENMEVEIDNEGDIL